MILFVAALILYELFAFDMRGIAMAATMDMMAMTMTNSMSENALLRFNFFLAVRCDYCFDL